jgi:hypothetical protein
VTPVDLSPDAIAARRNARERTGREGGYTGRELVGVADKTLRSAHKLRRLAERRANRSRAAHEKTLERARDALRTAAVQIRIAQVVPADKGYLHHLSLDRIQAIKAEVGRAFDEDEAALAVDTHKRIRDQRQRIAGGDA